MLLADYPGLTYDLEGVQKEQKMTLTALRIDAIFALVLIYALLAVPLRSYGQPLIIMAVSPPFEETDNVYYGAAAEAVARCRMLLPLKRRECFGQGRLERP